MSIAYAGTQTGKQQAIVYSKSAAMSGASTPGNAIRVWAAGYRDSAGVPNPTCSDTVNGAYTRDAFVAHDIGDGSYSWAALFWVADIGAGTPTVTVSTGSSSDYDITEFNAREYSGLAASLLTDLNQTNNGGSGSAFDTGTATGTTATTDELLCAVCAADVSGANSPCAWTENVSGSSPSSGWSSVLQETSGTTYIPCDGVEYIASSSVTNPIHKWTIDKTAGDWAACVGTLKGGGGGATIVAVNQVTESDTAQAITPNSVYAVTQASETDTSQTVAPARDYDVGQAEEVTTAATIPAGKAKTLGQPAETDISQAISPARVYLLGQPSETDVSQIIAMLKGAFIGQTNETDFAQSMSRAKAVTLTQPSETDLAQGMIHAKTLAIGQVSETDLAQVISAVRAYTVGQASETDLAQAISTMTGTHVVAVELVEEIDLAQAISWAPKARLAAQVVEADLAQSMEHTKAALVGQALENELAQVIGRIKLTDVGQAAETDTALAVSWAPKARLVNQVLETDTALVITVVTPGALIFVVLKELSPRYVMREVGDRYAMQERP